MWLLVFLPAAFLLAIFVPEAAAQSAEPVILVDQAIVDFPETVTFRLELDIDQPIAEATLTYQLGQNSCLSAGTQVPVEGEGPNLEWTWIMSRSGNPPPGAEMWWEWTVTDAAGNEFTTPRKSLTFEDARFDWRTIESGVGGTAPVRLSWYRGDEVGPLLLEAAGAALDRLQGDIGIKLLGQVQFFIYGSAADMRDALLYVQDWAGGVAFNEYNTILIGVPPEIADTWGTSTVRHELAHLVIGQFGFSCLGGSRPTWLNEGLAVYAEGEPEEDVRRDIEDGIANNTFQPVRSLNGAFPARGSDAGSAYSQSYSLVAYLLQAYGQEKMQALLLTLASGEDYDRALEQVYGFNADGLEVEWRAAIGAPPRVIPPTPTPISAASVPTVVPLGGIQSVPTPVEARPGDGTAGEDGSTDQVVGSQPTATAARPAAEDSGSGICAAGLVPLALVLTLTGAVIPRARIRGSREGE